MVFVQEVVFVVFVFEDDVVKLLVFIVFDEKDFGYCVFNFIVGMCFNIFIKDILLNIQVFIKDFYDDFVIINQIDFECYNVVFVNGNVDICFSNLIQQVYNVFFFCGFV